MGRRIARFRASRSPIRPALLLRAIPHERTNAVLRDRTSRHLHPGEGAKGRSRSSRSRSSRRGPSRGAPMRPQGRNGGRTGRSTSPSTRRPTRRRAASPRTSATRRASCSRHSGGGRLPASHARTLRGFISRSRRHHIRETGVPRAAIQDDEPRREVESAAGRVEPMPPCRALRGAYPRAFRHRPRELARLGEALAAVEYETVELPSIAPAIRLLLFTGARLSEVLKLQWKSVDLEAGVIRLEDSKTGPKTIQLNPAAKQILAALPRGDSNPCVIRGRF